MPFPKPAELPEWATFPTVPNVDPALADKQHGFVPTQRPPAQWFNWLFNLVYQWCAYLFDFENNSHTWTSPQTMNAGWTWGITQSWTANSPWLTLDMVTGMGLPNAINGIYLIGHNATDPVVSNAGGVLLVSNNDIGAAIRAWNTGTGGVVAYLQNTGNSSWGLKIAQAAADSLGVALQIDVSATNGTGILVQGSSGGAYMNGLFNAGGAPTLQLGNTGGGRALQIGQGDAEFTGPALAANVAQPNRLSKGLVLKAWAVYVTDGAGGVALKSGQGISGVAIVAGTNGNGVEVTWASPFLDLDHVCIYTGAMHGGAPAVGTHAQPQQVANLDTKVNVGHWDLNPIGPAITFLNAAAQSIRGWVIVTGQQ